MINLHERMLPDQWGSNPRPDHQLDAHRTEPLRPAKIMLNPFIPKFLQWTLPFLNLDMSTEANRCHSKIKNRMAISVDSDEIARYEPSHLDLHCLHRFLFLVCRAERIKRQ